MCSKSEAEDPILRCPPQHHHHAHHHAHDHAQHIIPGDISPRSVSWQPLLAAGGRICEYHLQLGGYFIKKNRVVHGRKSYIMYASRPPCTACVQGQGTQESYGTNTREK